MLKLKLYKFSKRTKEYKTLVNATNENATRVDIKKAQVLIDSISLNILAIYLKLDTIERAILSSRLNPVGSIFQEINNGNNELDVDITNYTNIDFSVQGIEKEVRYELSLHDKISRIKKFIDLDFDHSSYQKDINKLEKKINEDDFDRPFDKSLAPRKLNAMKVPINKTIEDLLIHYSDLSYKLERYFNLLTEFNIVDNIILK
jgi:hypothetical protein